VCGPGAFWPWLVTTSLWAFLGGVFVSYRYHRFLGEFRDEQLEQIKAAFLAIGKDIEDDAGGAQETERSSAAMDSQESGEDRGVP
jgi:hypothetical protein